MKIFLQGQSSECGLACLAMIAWHHGHRSDLPSLRRRFPASLKGTSLSRLLESGADLGLVGRALRLEVEDLRELQLPCILHWNMSHYVVLEKADSRRITIVDPASGRRTLDIREASSHFTGVALELAPGGSFAKTAAPPRVALSQLTGRLQGFGAGVAQILALSSVLQLFVLAVPLYLQWVMDQALPSADRGLLGVLGAAFALLVCFHAAAGFFRGWLVIQLSSRMAAQWSANVFAHVMRLPLSFFEHRHLGDVVSRMGAVQTIQRTVTTSSIEAVIDGVMALATLTMMWLYSPLLALVTMSAVSLYLALRMAALARLRASTERHLEAHASQHTYLLESIRGIQSLKSTASETFRTAAFANLAGETVANETRISRLGLTFATLEQFLFGVERVVVIWLGAQMVLAQSFSIGMLVAFLAYKELFATRMAGLVNKWVEFRMLRLHGERLADVVFEAPEEGLEGRGGARPADASLEVCDLRFRYAQDERWIVEDCSFRIEDGQSVALIGPSGCGKSTLVKLLLGLYESDAGRILVGGQDIRSTGLAGHRRLVSAVMQDDQLFAGTVADNIAFGDDRADMDRVREAARLAAVDAEIEAMPMGYHSLIGDLGTVLSGGQKQRVILARALYREPRILILDEATSHLDSECERRVNDAVRRLKLTRIIIAHRPSTIESADLIMRLDRGRVVVPPVVHRPAIA